MEGKLEGFDPTKHRMLEDEKSWVNEKVPKWDFEPVEVKHLYNGFVDRVIATNPDLSFQQAYDKILELEKKYEHRFFGVTYSDDPNRKLVFERRRLSQLEELNLSTEEEKQTLEQLRADFAQIVAEVAEATGDDPVEIQKNLDTALVYNVAKDLFEAKEIMIKGPIVEGFGETQDARIPNTVIREFLKATFTPEVLRKAKVGRIGKDDKYMIFRGRSQEHTEKGNELSQKGIARWDDGGMMIAEDRESYLQAEMFLEGVDDPSKLKHTFKIRATAGDSSGFHKIQLRSFGVEKPADFDYLAATGLDSEEDQMRAYILGTIAHEVAHRYENQVERKVFEEYKQILGEEVAQQARPRFVSDYVVKHSEMYGSDEQLLLKEDFAETVRLYATNPDYLRTNYPRRFAFIEQNFPFIKSSSVVEAVKRIKE